MQPGVYASALRFLPKELFLAEASISFGTEHSFRCSALLRDT
jgi:hypothetical protein